MKVSYFTRFAVPAVCRPNTCSRYLHQFPSDSSRCNATSGLSALGNCIACNDYVALVHTDIDKVRAGRGYACVQSFAAPAASDVCGLSSPQETEELIADVLGVRDYRRRP